MNSVVNYQEDIERQFGCHAVPELIIGSIAAAAVAATVWDASGAVFVLGWVLAMLLVYGARLWFTRKKPQLNDEIDSKESPASLIGLPVTGLRWGIAAVGSLWIFGMTWVTGIVLATTAILTILVLGCYLGARRIVIAYAIGSGAPIGVAGLVMLDRTSVVVGVASLLFMVVISMSAKYIDRLAGHSRAVDTERKKVVALLKTSTEEIKRLEIGAKTNADERLALEQVLDEASSNLLISQRKAEALASALDRVSPHDAQSGLLNAKKYVNVLEREWARMLRQESPTTVVHIKIDNFDDYKINYDNVAHEAVIRRVAELMRRTGTRPGGVVARIEKNRFALLLPEADHKNGSLLADSLRKKIRELNVPNQDSPIHAILTASFGLATVIPNSDISIEELNRRADAGLYEAQFQGGDKVVQFRVMSEIRLERWNRDMEGEFTADGMVRKLAILGYETRPKIYKPSEYNADRRIQIDTVDAIVQGRLKVSLEGESQILNPGDCLFIPRGLVVSTEIVGEEPVICLEASRV